MKKKFLAALCVTAGLLAGGTAEAAVATVDMRALFTDNPSWQDSARHAAERRAQLNGNLTSGQRASPAQIWRR